MQQEVLVTGAIPTKYELKAFVRLIRILQPELSASSRISGISQSPFQTRGLEGLLLLCEHSAHPDTCRSTLYQLALTLLDIIFLYVEGCKLIFIPVFTSEQASIFINQLKNG